MKWLSILVLALGVGVGGYIQLSRPELLRSVMARPAPAPVSEPPATQPTVSQPTVPEAAISPYNPTESDPTAIRILTAVTADSRQGPWLEGVKGIVEQFTNAVRNIAEGDSPRMALFFLKPQGRFQVYRARGRYFIAQTSFARYDAATGIITSIDADEAMLVWKELKPFMDQAFKGNSRPSERLERFLVKAIDHLLEVPPVPARIEVFKEPGVHVIYTFADPELEKLSAAQKHLLRMGPANAQSIQAKLHEWRVALELSKRSEFGVSLPSE